MKRHNWNGAARNELLCKASAEEVTQKSLASHGQRNDVAANGMGKPLDAPADIFVTEDAATDVRIGNILPYKIFEVCDYREFRGTIGVFFRNVDYVDGCTRYFRQLRELRQRVQVAGLVVRHVHDLRVGNEWLIFGNGQHRTRCPFDHFRGVASIKKLAHGRHFAGAHDDEIDIHQVGQLPGFFRYFANVDFTFKRYIKCGTQVGCPRLQLRHSLAADGVGVKRKKGVFVERGHHDVQNDQGCAAGLGQRSRIPYCIGSTLREIHRNKESHSLHNSFFWLASGFKVITCNVPSL